MNTRQQIIQGGKTSRRQTRIQSQKIRNSRKRTPQRHRRRTRTRRLRPKRRPRRRSRSLINRRLQQLEYELEELIKDMGVNNDKVTQLLSLYKQFLEIQDNRQKKLLNRSLQKYR
jgi:hypothetical protein